MLIFIAFWSKRYELKFKHRNVFKVELSVNTFPEIHLII